ncbi:hypothetical protein HBH76_193090 [Parastagonospora nodorum]|nr:hypothetical protein HBH76_193090 [Parastagonospora nodorum]
MQHPLSALELEARHSLLNLSVYNLVEEFARHSVYAVFKYLASSSNLSITIRCRASSLIYTKQAYLYADKYSKKYLKVCEADALKQVDVNRLELEAQLRKASEEEELAKTKKEKREKELTTIYSANKQTRIRDSLSIRLIGAYILYFKELLSNNSKIFASVIGITRTRAIVLSAIIGYKNKVVAIDLTNSTLCDLSNLLVIRFCIFSNSALENIGILTNKKVVEMQTNTATALANKLAAINKLVRLQTFILKILEHANMPAMHSKATKHCLALLAAQFALVCSFRKVDRYVFRANNTISIIAQRIITQTVFNKFYNCKLEGIIIAKFYKNL